MKKTIYTCDGPDCGRSSSSTESWLSIESIDKKLSVVNKLPMRRLIELNNHESIHFCSTECLQNLLVNSAPAVATGADLILIERKEQIQKHGWNAEHDNQHTNNELLKAAQTILQSNPVLWPEEWASYYHDKIMAKPRKEQLIICGAFIAAEIDRIDRI